MRFDGRQRSAQARTIVAADRQRFPVGEMDEDPRAVLFQAADRGENPVPADVARLAISHVHREHRGRHLPNNSVRRRTHPNRCDPEQPNEAEGRQCATEAQHERSADPNLLTRRRRLQCKKRESDRQPNESQQSRRTSTLDSVRARQFEQFFGRIACHLGTGPRERSCALTGATPKRESGTDRPRGILLRSPRRHGLP